MKQKDLAEGDHPDSGGLKSAGECFGSLTTFSNFGVTYKLSENYDSQLSMAGRDRP